MCIYTRYLVGNIPFIVTIRHYTGASIIIGFNGGISGHLPAMVMPCLIGSAADIIEVIYSAARILTGVNVILVISQYACPASIS